MRISQIEIRNFRGIRHGRITLPAHAVLLGANNSGKTTIVESLALLFGRERMVRPVSDWDFYGGAPKPDSRFHIIATITGFPSDDAKMLPGWFVGEHAARPVWWHDDMEAVSFESDPPDGARLAAQVALTGRYDDETCEFELARYFYDGECDPFTDGYNPVSAQVVRDVGLFLLSSNREWDRLLSFGSSTLLKVLREYDALPGKALEELKAQLRTGVVKIEEASPLCDILDASARELQSFLLIQPTGKLVYRPTSLDAVSVLQSLVAHVSESDDLLVPVSRQGAGMISLQAFLLLLAFAEQRRTKDRNFILAAEEPELHLHPSLHQRLVHRIRASSVQSIVTTQSPHVAAGYQPSEVIFVKNLRGELTAAPVRKEAIRDIGSKSVRKLYLAHRGAFYEALMGGVILVPEGMYDFEWLSLWQRLAQSSPDSAMFFRLRPITILPTSDAALVESFKELSKFRLDAIPVVDGDTAGTGYLNQLISATPSPLKLVRYGDGAATECLAAWILEPALAAPGSALGTLLPSPANRTLRGLQDALVDATTKKDRELRENLVWESLPTLGCCNRAGEFFHDLAAIAFGEQPKNSGWTIDTKPSGTKVFAASHIRRA
ncbi:MAG TPA: AAA family ATPase [Candidatus Dormibacteraeota bacterium]|nr:AAA family ATPase [Candidatus Dormibacteraeota bacterium]